MMRENPDSFPEEKQSHFMLQGPSGLLETLTTTPTKGVSRGVGIVCHPHPLFDGSMANKVVHTLAKAFDRKGLKTVRFNFRGVGQSQGSFADAIGETDDLLAIMNWVNQVEKKPPIWLAGFSFGAYVAACGAQKLAVQQLITIAPAVTRYSFEQLTGIKVPWLIVQGTDDEVVDPNAVKTWAQDLKAKQHTLVEYCEMPGTSHFFHSKLLDLRSLVESHLVHLE